MTNKNLNNFNRKIKYNKSNFSKNDLLKFYENLLLPRLIEEKMLILLRQNKISKWFSGIGQEAISVGLTLALQSDEYILPMHRNLGVFTSRDIPLNKLFSQWQGKSNGFTKGRDRSFHFGTKEHHIVGMISHLGAQLGVADGVALATKLSKEKKVTAVFTGDGGTSEGDFHEALNVAAVWDLPVLFIIEANGYGLSTPSNEQYRFDSFLDKGPAYGIEASSVDGNNILEVFSKIDEIAQSIRKNPKPHILECKTFRMRGHEESSGTKYVPKDLMKSWAEKDPIKNYEVFLLEKNIIDQDYKNEIYTKIKNTIDENIEKAFSENVIEAKTENEISDVYKKFNSTNILPKGNKTEKRFVDAISDGIYQSLEKHDNLIMMGQDIAEYGGVFKVSQGFLEKFGKDRIRNTPICESAIVGAALGLSIKSYKSIVEMQFADFVSCGFNQIVNNLAKVHYRWGENADVVVRMPTGAGVGAGPFHSQSNEAWFFHTPGLKIVYPSNPTDAKGLLTSAINDPNPVMYFEHKLLYRSIKEEIPDQYYTTEIGKASVIKEGNDLTIITYGMGVHWAKHYLSIHNNINADLIDLRTLVPYDKETIIKSVKKTNKVIILHEDTLTGGIGAEISAWISRHLFSELEAPIYRVGSLDTPVPFAHNLEENFLPMKRFEKELLELYNY